MNVLAIRTFSQATVNELACHATIPVINALSDLSHPCQAMADMVTILEERGSLQGRKLVFVGDGNNVARSLAVASALLGLHFVLSAPPGYAFPVEFHERFATKFPDVPLVVESDTRKAVKGADIVYTDVWASMGQEQEADQRREVFAPFQVSEGLMARAAAQAIFLHCLPAHRGEEVTSAVLDGPRSRVIPQAANRMYFQMALLTWLLGRHTLGKRHRSGSRPLMTRIDGRASGELRPVTIERGFVVNSSGSVLFRAGQTAVLVTAQLSEGVPTFLEGKGVGWLTAEYSMLPGSTPTRSRRGSDGRRHRDPAPDRPQPARRGGSPGPWPLDHPRRRRCAQR